MCKMHVHITKNKVDYAPEFFLLLQKQIGVMKTFIFEKLFTDI